MSRVSLVETNNRDGWLKKLEEKNRRNEIETLARGGSPRTDDEAYLFIFEK